MVAWIHVRPTRKAEPRMIIRYTHVIEIDVDDLSINDVAAALADNGQWPNRNQIRAERASLEVVEKNGTPVAYAGASVVGATTD